MPTVQDMICKPFRVSLQEVTSAQIANAINMLANVPAAFEASELSPAILPYESYHTTQEALNRLMQRWRKLGLVKFKTGRWTLTKGAWDQMQAAARAVGVPS